MQINMGALTNEQQIMLQELVDVRRPARCLSGVAAT